LLASVFSESSLDTRRPAETDSKNLECRGKPCRAFLGLPRNIKARLPETLGRTDLRSKS